MILYMMIMRYDIVIATKLLHWAFYTLCFVVCVGATNTCLALLKENQHAIVSLLQK